MTTLANLHFHATTQVSKQTSYPYLINSQRKVLTQSNLMQPQQSLVSKPDYKSKGHVISDYKLHQDRNIFQDFSPQIKQKCLPW